jgi:hypothetical protein
VSAPLGVLTRVLRWLGLSVLAGLITAAGAATLLTLTWLMVEGAGALTNVPYAGWASSPCSWPWVCRPWCCSG